MVTYRHHLRRLVRYSQAASDVLDFLSKARGGGVVEWGLGSIAVAGRLAGLYLPAENASIYLDERGYRPFDLPMNSRLISALLSSDYHRRTMVVGDDHLTVHEFLGRDTAVVLSPYGQFSELYVRGGLPRDLFRPLFWAESDSLTLFFRPQGGSSFPTSLVFDYRPMGELRDFVGSPKPSDVLGPGHSVGSGFTCLLVGPTGSGKTTLARRIVAQAGLKTLVRVSAPTLDQGRAHGVLNALKLMGPDAVLVDDIPLRQGEVDHQLLELFEALEGLVPMVLGTLMVDDKAVTEMQRPGALYWPGMRPGRIDRVIFLPRPDADARREILRHYGEEILGCGSRLTDVVQATGGLTGAYLKRLVAILEARGSYAGWEEVVEQLRWQAPMIKPRTSSGGLESAREIPGPAASP